MMMFQQRVLRWCFQARWVVAGILASCAFGLVSCGNKTERDSVPPATDTATSSAPATAAVNPQFQKLLGKWERPDGGYVLELKSVEAGGKLEAGYFNPNPINVSKALAIQEGSTTKVFVELRDVNYPGCTYSLTYDPQTDQLYGQYFQASMERTYDVTFGRLKEQP